MAQQQGDRLLSILGYVAYGDFADLTTYKSKRGKIVWFTKTWPDKPPSDRQLYDRARFSAAAQAWNNLPAEDKAQWNLAAARASICATGYNLYMFCWLAPHTETLTTIARQTGCTLNCACFYGTS